VESEEADSRAAFQKGISGTKGHANFHLASDYKGENKMMMAGES
jgi:hypothetical protein